MIFSNFINILITVIVIILDILTIYISLKLSKLLGFRWRLFALALFGLTVRRFYFLGVIFKIWPYFNNVYSILDNGIAGLVSACLFLSFIYPVWKESQTFIKKK